MKYIRSKQDLDNIITLATKGNSYATSALKQYIDTESTNKEMLVLVYRKCKAKDLYIQKKSSLDKVNVKNKLSEERNVMLD
jgi:hypothetical protein